MFFIVLGFFPSPKKNLSIICSLLFLFCMGLDAQSKTGVLVTQAAGQQPKRASTSAGSQQMTNIPYFSLKDGMNSTLTLNNNMPVQTTVMITVYSKSGKPLMVPPVTLKPSSIANYQLADLTANAGNDFDSGNIAIMYDGPSMGVTCQVGIFDPKSRVSFESRDAGMMDFMSLKLNGIISLPDAKADSFVALTNIATHPVKVQWSIGAAHDQLSLKSRETQVMNLTEAALRSLPNGNGNAHQVAPVLLQVQHDGEVGTIIATGFVLDLERGYSSDFWLVDSATTPSNHLSAAHVRFGNADVTEGFPVGTSFRAPLALANVSSGAVTATVSADYTLEGKPQNLKLATVSLEPGEVKQLELSEEMVQFGVSGPVEDAGVDVDYDGAPGSVIASLTSVDQSGDFSFEVPVKDPAEMDHMPINSYPWTLENGTRTVVHLKNTTAEDQWAVLQFRFPDGSTYNPDRIHLQPYETVPIDIQQLKDSRQKDVRKQVFPEKATSGQLVWFEETPKTIIGRAEHLNLAAGTSRSFSCGAPCTCPPSFYEAAMSPGPLAATIGSAGNFFSPEYTTEDCNGFDYGPFAAAGTLQSSNTSVATVSSGVVSCLAPGTTSISATIHERIYIDLGTTCRGTLATATPSATLAVYDPTPNITGISPGSWNAGTSTSVRVTGTGFGTSPTISITDPAGSIIGVTVTAASNTEIDAIVSISGTAPVENATVTVTSHGYNGQGFTSNQGNGPNSPTVGVPINPAGVGISGPRAVVNGATAGFGVSDQNGIPVTLTITSTGNGRATFGGNTSTSVNNSSTVTVSGSAISSSTDDLTITAKDEFGSLLTSIHFSVISVTISLRSANDNQVSATDGVSSLYAGFVGSTNLGVMAGKLGPNGINNMCVAGHELVATVLPADFPGPLTIKRTLISGACWDGSSPTSCPKTPPADDTGPWFTTDPQQQTTVGSANGNVYNLDAPSINFGNGAGPTPPPIRIRFNWTANVIGPDGTTVVSQTISFFTRLSCLSNDLGVATLQYDASANDNQIGSGSTTTSPDLK